MGILGLFYKLCDFAFVGGSLEKVGGHNPYEAINLDCAVITGQNYFNFQQTYDELIDQGGCLVFKDVIELEEVVSAIFREDIEPSLSDLLLNGKRYLKNSSSVSEKLVSNIKNLF